VADKPGVTLGRGEAHVEEAGGLRLIIPYSKAATIFLRRSSEKDSCLHDRMGVDLSGRCCTGRKEFRWRNMFRGQGRVSGDEGHGETVCEVHSHWMPGTVGLRFVFLGIIGAIIVGGSEQV
jgi:hypothetical protein